MLKSLFPWKHNKTKQQIVVAQQTTMDDELLLQEQSLLPCHVCGRTFLPNPLKKHTKVCEKNAAKKRKPFDSLKQRVEGTDLAAFHQKSYLKKHSQPEVTPYIPPVEQAKKTKPNKWKEKHLELVTAIRAAKGVPSEMRSTVSPTSNHHTKAKSSTSLTAAAPTERCPSCDRQFGMRAFDRHVEWCMERKHRIQQSPAAVQKAKEMLEARIKYRAPLNRSKRSQIREKYSPSSPEAPPINVQSTSSTGLFSRGPSIRKPKSTVNLIKTPEPSRRVQAERTRDQTERTDVERARGDVHRQENTNEKKTPISQSPVPIIGSPSPKSESTKSSHSKKSNFVLTKLNSVDINVQIGEIAVSSISSLEVNKTMTTWKDTACNSKTPKSYRTLNDKYVSLSKANNAKNKVKSERKEMAEPSDLKTNKTVFNNDTFVVTNRVKNINSEPGGLNQSSVFEIGKILSSNDVLHKKKSKLPTKIFKKVSDFLKKDNEGIDIQESGGCLARETTQEIRTPNNNITDSNRKSFFKNVEKKNDNITNQKLNLDKSCSIESADRNSTAKSYEDKGCVDICLNEKYRFERKGFAEAEEVLTKENLDEYMTHSTKLSVDKGPMINDALKNNVIMENVDNKSKTSTVKKLDFVTYSGDFNKIETSVDGNYFKTVEPNFRELSSGISQVNLINNNIVRHTTMNSWFNDCMNNGNVDSNIYLEEMSSKEYSGNSGKEDASLVEKRFFQKNNILETVPAETLIESENANIVGDNNTKKVTFSSPADHEKAGGIEGENITKKNINCCKSFVCLFQSATSLNLTRENSLNTLDDKKSWSSVGSNFAKELIQISKFEEHDKSDVSLIKNNSKFMLKKSLSDIVLFKSTNNSLCNSREQNRNDVVPIYLCTKKSQFDSESVENAYSYHNVRCKFLRSLPNLHFGEFQQKNATRKIQSDQKTKERHEILRLAAERFIKMKSDENFDIFASDYEVSNINDEFYDVPKKKRRLHQQSIDSLDNQKSDLSNHDKLSDIDNSTDCSRSSSKTYNNKTLDKQNRTCENISKHSKEDIFSNKVAVVTSKSYEEQIKECKSSNTINTDNQDQKYILKSVQIISNKGNTTNLKDKVCKGETKCKYINISDINKELKDFEVFNTELIKEKVNALPKIDTSRKSSGIEPLLAKRKSCSRDNSALSSASDMVTPRTFNLIKKVLLGKKIQSETSDLLLAMTVNECQKLIQVDRKILPRIEKSINSEVRHKTDNFQLPEIVSRKPKVKTRNQEVQVKLDPKNKEAVKLPKINENKHQNGNLISPDQSCFPIILTDERASIHRFKSRSAITENFNVWSESSERKSLSADNSPSPSNYDPFEIAQRQFMELLECDDFKPFTPSDPLSTQSPNRPHTTPLASNYSSNNSSNNSNSNDRTPSPQVIKKTVKSAEVGGKKYPRASVIDPPVNFKDSFESVTDEFELIENLINKQFSEENSGNTDGFYLHSNLNNNKESLTLDHLLDNRKYSDDMSMSSIDPNLINENDNLSIPEHLKNDSYSPTSTICTEVTIQNDKDDNTDPYSLQYDEKIEATLDEQIKPKVDKKPLVKRSLSLVNRTKKEGIPTKVTQVTKKSTPGNKTTNKSSLASSVKSTEKEKKQLPLLKRSMTLFDPSPKPSFKTKKDVDDYLNQEQKMAKSFTMGVNGTKTDCKKKKTPSVEELTFKAEELFSVDDEMYEEYKKYEEMYLKDKEQRSNSRKKSNRNTLESYGLFNPNNEEDDQQNSNAKLSNDSAYGSLTRKTPKQNHRITKLTPLEQKQMESPNSSSGSENGQDYPAPSNNKKPNFDTLDSLQGCQKVSKFCHECGTRFPVDTAKFCIECGVKRLVL